MHQALPTCSTVKLTRAWPLVWGDLEPSRWAYLFSHDVTEARLFISCDHNPSLFSFLLFSATYTGVVCVRDRLTHRFCQTLRWLGRCILPNVRAQCCRTCGQRTPPRSGRTSGRWGITKSTTHRRPQRNTACATEPWDINVEKWYLALANRGSFEPLMKHPHFTV